MVSQAFMRWYRIQGFYGSVVDEASRGFWDSHAESPLIHLGV